MFLSITPAETETHRKSCPNSIRHSVWSRLGSCLIFPCVHHLMEHSLILQSIWDKMYSVYTRKHFPRLWSAGHNAEESDELSHSFLPCPCEPHIQPGEETAIPMRVYLKFVVIFLREMCEERIKLCKSIQFTCTWKDVSRSQIQWSHGYFNKRDENWKTQELGQRNTAKVFTNHQHAILKRPT